MTKIGQHNKFNQTGQQTNKTSTKIAPIKHLRTDSFLADFLSICIFWMLDLVSWTLSMTPALLFNLAVSILSFLAALRSSDWDLKSSAVLVAMVELTWKRFADSFASRWCSRRAVCRRERYGGGGGICERWKRTHGKKNTHDILNKERMGGVFVWYQWPGYASERCSRWTPPCNKTCILHLDQKSNQDLIPEICVRMSPRDDKAEEEGKFPSGPRLLLLLQKDNPQEGRRSPKFVYPEEGVVHKPLT